LLLLLPAPSAIAQVKAFMHAGIAKDAQRYEADLKTRTATGSVETQQLIATGQKALLTDKDPRTAARAFGRAAAVASENPEPWLLLARALLATQPDPKRPSERYELPADASAAAY